MKYFMDIVNIKNLKRLLMLILAVMIVYILIGPLNPAEFTSLTIKTENVYAGGKLTYVIKGCRHVGEGVRTDVLRSLIDSSDKTLTPVILSSDNLTGKEGCYTNTRSVIVPIDTPLGCYTLRIQAIYSMIAIRQAVPREISSKEKICIQELPIDNRIEQLQQQIQELQHLIQTRKEATKPNISLQNVSPQRQTIGNTTSSASTQVQAAQQSAQQSTATLPAASVPVGTPEQPAKPPGQQSTIVSLLQDAVQPVLTPVETILHIPIK
jgi:hypothetical protein